MTSQSSHSFTPIKALGGPLYTIKSPSEQIKFYITIIIIFIIYCLIQALEKRSRKLQEHQLNHTLCSITLLWGNTLCDSCIYEVKIFLGFISYIYCFASPFSTFDLIFSLHRLLFFSQSRGSVTNNIYALILPCLHLDSGHNPTHTHQK